MKVTLGGGGRVVDVAVGEAVATGVTAWAATLSLPVAQADIMIRVIVNRANVKRRAWEIDVSVFLCMVVLLEMNCYRYDT